MSILISEKIKHYFRWIFLSILCGLLAGIAAAIFLISLEWATKIRDSNPLIILILPLGGLFIGLTYHYFGRDLVAGSNLILDEIHDPKKIVPLSMTPMILISTIITHLFGGSAGREGTAVQMGASLADQLSHFFNIDPNGRKILLVAGAGAGFSAAIGAPWAGVIFGMEIINIGKLRLFAWFECLIASFIAYYTTLFLKAPHSQYPTFEMDSFTWKPVFFIFLAGIIFGLTAKLFSLATHTVEKLNNRYISYTPLRPFFAGILIVLLYYIEGSYRYVGLGINVIQESLKMPSSFLDPILKTFFTAVTIGSGFKGGEFIPLVFIGTTLGSAISIILPVSFKLLAALGFAAVFAGAANAPIACSLMAVEIFGLPILPYALIACFTSYYCSGHRGIYKSQKIATKKHHQLAAKLLWLGQLPKRFLNGDKNND